MANKKTSKEVLDDVLAQGLTIDDILAGAKTSLGRAERLTADTTLTPREIPRSTVEKVGSVVGPAANLGLIPLSLLGGPAGMIAGAPLAYEGVQEFRKAPSVWGGAMAALGALPYARALRGARAGKTAVEAGKAVPLAEDLGNTTRAGRPSAGFRQSKAAAEARRAYVREGAPGEAAAFTRDIPRVDPYAPNIPASVSGLINDVPGEAAPFTQGGPSLDRYMANTPARSVESLLEDIPVEALTPPTAPPSVSSVADLVPGHVRMARERLARQGAPIGRIRQPESAPESLQSLIGSHVTRVPRGVSGDEYATIRQGGGAFDTRWKLTPEEQALEDEFWTNIALGR